jgi:hypothetical protein
LLRQVGVGPKLVVFEAGHQLTGIAETVKMLDGVQVHVVHPNEVKWITESRGKTDRVDAKKLAEVARAGILPRAVHVARGTRAPVCRQAGELRELVSARQQLQRTRIALINTIRGAVDQAGHRWPEPFVTGPTWAAKLARLPVSAPLRLIREPCLTSLAALVAAEQQLTQRLVAIEDPRGPLLERSPAIGPLAARVVVSALDEAQRFEDSKAVANSGALAPTILLP